MQIQYSAVAAGNGSNPKSPPPVSQLLKQYILSALRVQEAVDDLQDDPANEVLLYAIRSHVNSMLSIYERMNDTEREIVEGSHIDPITARTVLHIAELILDEQDEEIAVSMVPSLSNLLYFPKAEACTLH